MKDELDTLTREELDRITSIDSDKLTPEEERFLRARVYYLTEKQEKKYLSVLTRNAPPANTVYPISKKK